MGAALLLGLGLVLIMALGRGVRAEPKKLPIPKKEEELAELDIKPYDYAMTEKPGTSDQAIADAREAGAREGAAEKEAAAAAGARAAAEKEIEAAREAGAAETAAARDAAAAAEAAAAEAGEREAAANAAAAREAAEKESAIAISREEAGRAREAQAEAERLASEARAAAEAARAETDETRRQQAAEIARAKAEAAKAAQMAAVASTKRANAAIAAAQEKAAKEGAAVKAAEDARQKKGDAQQAVADKKAKKIAAAAEAEAKQAKAKQAEEAAKARQRAAATKAAQERARKEGAAREAERLSREEAEKKAAEARGRAKAAAAAQRGADQEEANRQAAAARAAAEEARAKEVQADKLAAGTAVREDLEVKRKIVSQIFKGAVDRRQGAITTLKEVAPPPKPTVKPKVDPRKVLLVKKYYAAVKAYAHKVYQQRKGKPLPARILGEVAREFQRILKLPAAGGRRPITELQLWAMPFPMLKRRATQALVAAEATADARSFTKIEQQQAQWKGKLSPSSSALLQQPGLVAGMGYDFVGAVGTRTETRSESVNVVARHFRRRGIDLGKPSRKKAFWRQSHGAIQKKALAAANTIPLPRGVQKPAPVAIAPPPTRPTPAPPTPAPAVTPTRITRELVEKNRQTIANAFKQALAKRYKAFPSEPKQRRVNLVAAYFKARGVPLGKPATPPHGMHAGDPRKVATALASIVNAYQPRPATSGQMGVGPYHDFYGQDTGIPEETEIDAGPSLFEGQMPEETEIDAGPSLFEGQMPEETEIEAGPSLSEGMGLFQLGGWAS